MSIITSYNFSLISIQTNKNKLIIQDPDGLLLINANYI
jgi:hypothetical protein